MNIYEIQKLAGRNIIDYGFLNACLSSLKEPRSKIKRFLKDQSLIRIKKGLYVFGPKVSEALYSKEILANLIYGPSAISLEYALFLYGMIPERVEKISSITPQRDKIFSTPIGVFTYKFLSLKKYTCSLTRMQDLKGNSYLIATPEKALMDVLTFSAPPLRDLQSLKEYLEEDLRFDMSSLTIFNIQRVKMLKTIYKNKNINLFMKFMENLR